jgi:hypothetical protein
MGPREMILPRNPTRFEIEHGLGKRNRFRRICGPRFGQRDLPAFAGFRCAGRAGIEAP